MSAKQSGNDTEIPQVETSSLGTAILRTHSAGSNASRRGSCCPSRWAMLEHRETRRETRGAHVVVPSRFELQKAMRKPPLGVSKMNTAGTALGSISSVAMPQVFCTTKDWLGEVYNILLARSLCFARLLGFARNMICVESHVD
eukprot:Skav202569  [mRNA]  locus=scaffold2177:341547:341975:+ [translate_table: standard]